jgi:hypothetical protein
MADGDQKGPHVDVTVSAKLYEYLDFLSRNTILGRKESDVARTVLTRRLEQMLEEKYHESHAVPEDPKQVESGDKPKRTTLSEG